MIQNPIEREGDNCREVVAMKKWFPIPNQIILGMVG